MHSSLLAFALQVAPAIRKSEKAALDKQRKAKRVKQELLRKKKMLAMKTEYANALTYIHMFNSSVCWKTKLIAITEFGKLQSKTAKLDAVKEQIRIYVLGFGWRDLHHELPSRKETKQHGTRTVDVDELDSRYESEKGETIAKAVQMRDEHEDKGESTLYVVAGSTPSV